VKFYQRIGVCNTNDGGLVDWTKCTLSRLACYHALAWLSIEPLNLRDFMNCDRLILAAVVGLLCVGRLEAAEPSDYVSDGKLRRPLTLSHVQLGGFVGRLETTIAIDDDNAWKGSVKIGSRVKPKNGSMSAAQAEKLAASLSEQNLIGLPKIISAAKPVKSPRQIADGASTTITLTFGDQKVVAHFADGVQVDEATQKLRLRLRAIEAAMKAATLNAAAAQ